MSNALKVIGGDFKGLIYTGKKFAFSTGFMKIEQHPRKTVSVTVLTEENVKKLGGTLGAGLAGGLLLGTVGLLAGALVGGNKKRVSFVLELADGRKALCECDSSLYKQIIADGL